MANVKSISEMHEMDVSCCRWFWGLPLGNWQVSPCRTDTLPFQ